MEDILESTYREEKSLRHVAMLANFVDNNKPRMSLRKWIRTVSRSSTILFNCIQFVKNVGEIFWGWIRKLRKEKENFCAVSGTYVIKRAREIRKFRVAVVQRQLRNEQEERDLLFWYCFFAVFRCLRRPRCLSSLMLWSRNPATMVMWHNISPLYWEGN